MPLWRESQKSAEKLHLSPPGPCCTTERVIPPAKALSTGARNRSQPWGGRTERLTHHYSTRGVGTDCPRRAPHAGWGGVVSQSACAQSRFPGARRGELEISAKEDNCVRRRTQPPSALWSTQFSRRPWGGALGGGDGAGLNAEQKVSFSLQYSFLWPAVVATDCGPWKLCCPTPGKRMRAPRGRDQAGRSAGLGGAGVDGLGGPTPAVGGLKQLPGAVWNAAPRWPRDSSTLR